MERQKKGKRLFKAQEQIKNRPVGVAFRVPGECKPPKRKNHETLNYLQQTLPGITSRL
jgi:hypothetical protein